jgi:hypothetical protein
MILIAPAVDPHILKLHADRIKTALRYADISPTKAALWMSIDPRQFDRQLNGEGHISYTRLVMLPVLFWQWFGLLIVVQVGLPLVIRKSARLALTFMGFRKRMARMAVADLQPEAERKVG